MLILYASINFTILVIKTYNIAALYINVRSINFTILVIKKRLVGNLIEGNLVLISLY